MVPEDRIGARIENSLHLIDFIDGVDGHRPLQLVVCLDDALVDLLAA